MITTPRDELHRVGHHLIWAGIYQWLIYGVLGWYYLAYCGVFAIPLGIWMCNTFSETKTKSTNVAREILDYLTAKNTSGE